MGEFRTRRALGHCPVIFDATEISRSGDMDKSRTKRALGCPVRRKSPATEVCVNPARDAPKDIAPSLRKFFSGIV